MSIFIVLIALVLLAPCIRAVRKQNKAERELLDTVIEQATAEVHAKYGKPTSLSDTARIVNQLLKGE